MKRIMHVVLAIALALVFCGTVFGAKTFTLLGNRRFSYDGAFLTGTPVLVFPHATLADLEGCCFSGRMGGAAIDPLIGLSNTPTVYPTGATGATIQRIEFDITTKHGTTNTKAVHIKLTQQADGVYAQATKAYHIAGDFMGNVYYTITADGTVNWASGPNYNHSIASGPNTGDYGVRTLEAVRLLKSTPQLAFASTTVAEIWTTKRAFDAKTCGGGLFGAQNCAWTVTNLVVTAAREDTTPTAMRLECQYVDGGTLKCAVVNLQDGEGGVWATLSKNLHVPSADYALGFKFFTDSGDVVTEAVEENVNTASFWTGYYGVRNFTLTLNPPDVHYMSGPAANLLWDKGAYLTGSPQLVFPGVTLADLKDCMFYGTMDGGNMGNGGNTSFNSGSYHLVRYPADAADDEITHLYFDLSSWVAGKVWECCIVDLTDGPGGVYAAVPLAAFKYSWGMTPAFTVNTNEKGAPVVSLGSGFSKQSVATYDHGVGYGIKALGISKFLGVTPTLAFPGLTIDQIRFGRFSAKPCGGSILVYTDEYVMGDVIVTQTDANGKATAARVEAVYPSSVWAKGVNVYLTNGEGGVYALLNVAGYLSSADYYEGRSFFTNAGGRVSGVLNGSVAETPVTDGYALFDLAVSLDDTELATATWTGKAGTGDMNDPANWECRSQVGAIIPNALPDEHAVTTIGKNIVMSADGDLSMVKRFVLAAGVTIDLNGWSFKVKTLANCAASTITGTGELHVVVPADLVARNETVALTGALKLVKEGEGVFSVFKQYQPYRGGNEVREGTFRVCADPSNWCLGGNGVRDSIATTNTVLPGAMFDPNGQVGYAYNTFVLAGGCLTGQTAMFNTKVILTDDSKIEPTGAFVVPDSQRSMLDLNGHTLDVVLTAKGSSFTGGYSQLEDGVLAVEGEGTFQLAKALDARTVDFLVNAKLNLTYPMSVRDYRAGYTANDNAGFAALNVYGTFTPASEYFYGCTLMNGAVIDLSEKTDAWSMASASEDGTNAVQFASGSTITIQLGNRPLAYGDKIVAWDEKPANLATLRFKQKSGQSGAIGKRNDGLYFEQTTFAIFVR